MYKILLFHSRAIPLKKNTLAQVLILKVVSLLKADIVAIRAVRVGLGT